MLKEDAKLKFFNNAGSEVRRGGACAHARRASAWGTAGDVCAGRLSAGLEAPGVDAGPASQQTCSSPCRER